jgi:hypothetical protein
VVVATIAAGHMHAAVLMVPVPPAVEVRPARIAMHVTPVALAASGDVQLAVLVVSMPSAVQVRAVGPAVDVAMMVPVPVIAGLDIDVLDKMHGAIRIQSERLHRYRLRACRRERENQPRAQ